MDGLTCVAKGEAYTKRGAVWFLIYKKNEKNIEQIFEKSKKILVKILVNSRES